MGRRHSKCRERENERGRWRGREGESERERETGRRIERENEREGEIEREREREPADAVDERPELRTVLACQPPQVLTPARKIDVRLPGKGNSNSHGARPVH